MAEPISRWRTVLATVIAAYMVPILIGVGFIYSGAYDIGVDAHHWGLTYQVFETARVHSIKAHAAGITPPAGLDDQAKILAGVEHFAEHCAVCHGAPGVPKDDIANGLYPQPPDLAVAANRYAATELFWIIKHGIKMTGMPSWGDHGDDELWATVAFLRKLPGLTPEDYVKLVMQAISHGGQHHPGGKGVEAGPHPGDAETGTPHEHGGGAHQTMPPSIR
jgi:mono/diheme cytochrome c family protein